MTANHEHTPSTDEVREAAESDNPYGCLEEGQFDRWLAEHDARIEAAAEQRGAIKALRDFADAHRMPFVMFSGKDYRVTVSDLLRETARNIEQRYRADQMEGDDA